MKFTSSKNRNQLGFTLIELLVVISIIGLLSTVVLASLNVARAKARDARRMSDLNEVQKALELYASDHNGSYPATASPFPNSTGYDATHYTYSDPTCNVAGVTVGRTDWIPELVTGGYIASLPKDPGPPKDPGGNSQTGCYMYTSDGKYYILSAWGTAERDVSTNAKFYRHFGFQSTPYNLANNQYCMKYSGYDGAYSVSYSYYAHSFTLSNYDDSTWSDSARCQIISP